MRSSIYRHRDRPHGGALAEVVGLISEATRKIVSRRIGALPPNASAPIASMWTWPRRSISVLRPGTQRGWTWL
jgi:hypothetical protein